MMLAGKIALVTGGSRGIGKAISIRLAEAGAMVMLTYRDQRELADDTVRTIQQFGGKAEAAAARGGARSDPGLEVQPGRRPDDHVDRRIDRFDDHGSAAIPEGARRASAGADRRGRAGSILGCV